MMFDLLKCGEFNVSVKINQRELNENLKAWICEHCADYERYAVVMRMCGCSMDEIIRDLEGCADEEEIDDILKVLAEVE